MKKVIQRTLPLNVKYQLISVSYLSIEDGGGCNCDNCGRLITNIAHIKGDDSYCVGLDCLESIIINNGLLDVESHFQYMQSDKPAFAKAKSLRAKILKKVKTDSNFSAKLHEFANGFGFSFSSKRIISGQQYNEPLGWDYSFDLKYKDLTLNYVKDIPNVYL